MGVLADGELLQALLADFAAIQVLDKRLFFRGGRVPRKCRGSRDVNSQVYVRVMSSLVQSFCLLNLFDGLLHPVEHAALGGIDRSDAHLEVVGDVLG